MMALKTCMMVLLTVACLMPALVVQEAQAAPAWYTVWVNDAGQQNANKYATVTDATGTVPAINASQYLISGTPDNEAVLLVAKTAMARVKPVEIYIDLAVTPTVISGLGMLQ